MKDNKSDAYAKVFRDMMLHGPEFFKGMHDARADGADEFMYGIQTVMEHIAWNVDEETFIKFSDMFTKNLVLSKKKWKIPTGNEKVV